jgi:hypothetical protein
MHREHRCPDGQAPAEQDHATPATAHAVGDAIVQRVLQSVGALTALGLYGVLGNAPVQRMLVHRDGPRLTMPEFGSSLGHPSDWQFRLHLEPAIEAQLRATKAMGRMLDPSAATAALGQGPGGAEPLPAPEPPVPAQRSTGATTTTEPGEDFAAGLASGGAGAPLQPAGGGLPAVLPKRVDWHGVNDIVDERWAQPDAGTPVNRHSSGSSAGLGHVGTGPPD